MRFPFVLVFGVLGSASEAGVIGFLQVLKSPCYHPFRDVVGPRILLLPALIELLFQCKSVRRFQLALLLGNGFLLFFVRLILLLPLFAPPVVDKSSGATGSFEVLRLVRRRVDPYLVRGFQRPVPL